MMRLRLLTGCGPFLIKRRRAPHLKLFPFVVLKLDPRCHQHQSLCRFTSIQFIPYDRTPKISQMRADLVAVAGDEVDGELKRFTLYTVRFRQHNLCLDRFKSLLIGIVIQDHDLLGVF